MGGMMPRVEAAQRVCGDAWLRGRSALQLCVFARGVQAQVMAKLRGCVHGTDGGTRVRPTHPGATPNSNWGSARGRAGNVRQHVCRSSCSSQLGSAVGQRHAIELTVVPARGVQERSTATSWELRAACVLCHNVNVVVVYRLGWTGRRGERLTSSYQLEWYTAR